MTNPNEHVTVTQADRDRFEELFLFGVGPMAEKMLKDGVWDGDYRMQGLARHRIEATANVEPVAITFTDSAAAVEAVQLLLERGKAYVDINGYLTLVDAPSTSARITDDEALLQEAREALAPFARDTALAHAGKMETMRIRLPLEVFDAARAFLTKLDAALGGA